MYYSREGWSREEIRGLATILRSGFGINESLYVPIVDILELQMAKVDPRFCLRVVEDREINADALCRPDQYEIIVRESVYYDATRGMPRARFTLAHELGHYILHRKTNVSYARGLEKIPAYLNPEWQANTFAGEFLAPPALIREMSEDEIACKCKVSKQVARIQKGCI